MPQYSKYAALDIAGQLLNRANAIVDRAMWTGAAIGFVISGGFAWIYFSGSRFGSSDDVFFPALIVGVIGALVNGYMRREAAMERVLMVFYYAHSLMALVQIEQNSAGEVNSAASSQRSSVPTHSTNQTNGSRAKVSKLGHFEPLSDS